MNNAGVRLGTMGKALIFIGACMVGIAMLGYMVAKHHEDAGQYKYERL